MNLVIERMGDHIGPFVEDMLRVLPQLWQRSEGSSLVRIQVRTDVREGSSAFISHHHHLSLCLSLLHLLSSHCCILPSVRPP